MEEACDEGWTIILEQPPSAPKNVARRELNQKPQSFACSSQSLAAAPSATVPPRTLPLTNGEQLHLTVPKVTELISKVAGTVYLTNFFFVFFPDKKEEELDSLIDDIWIPIATIDKAVFTPGRDFYQDGSGGTVEIFCKDFRFMSFQMTSHFQYQKHSAPVSHGYGLNLLPQFISASMMADSILLQSDYAPCLPSDNPGSSPSVSSSSSSSSSSFSSAPPPPCPSPSPSVPPANPIQQLAEGLQRLGHFRQGEAHAFWHDCEDGGGGWQVFNWVREFGRQGATAEGSGWRLSHANHSGELCPSYPAVLAVPQGVSDDDLWEGAKFRSRGRLPVLTFLHRGTGASITRGAQPLPGLLSFRSRADEAALAAIRQANPRGGERPLVIVDCRSRLSALANSAKGAGTESPQNYGGCRVEHLGVGNIHAMRQALRAVFLACSRPAPGSFAGWLPWMGHLELLLSAASQVAQLVGRWGTSVFVHCSDGWDRTAQLAGLAQVLAEPFFRSLEGFAVLVEKDWAGFGHKFADRCGHGQPGGFWDEHERSPIFLQWLDCLHQLQLQFPQAFEYNEQFLCAVMDHVYSCSFGTFLFNSPLEREQAGVRQSCPSLWSWTSLPAQRRRFVNPLYSPTPGLLLPDCSPQRLKPWGGYFCRWRGALQLRLPEDALLGRVRELTEQQAGLQESLGCLSRRLHSALGELREAQRGQTALRQTARLVVREDPAGGPPRYVAELPLQEGGEDAGRPGAGEEVGGIIEDYEDPALQEAEGGGWINLRPRPLAVRGSWAELLGVDLAKLGGLASAVVSSVWATAASLPFPALVQPPPSHPLEAEEVEEDDEEGGDTEEFEMYRTPELPQ